MFTKRTLRVILFFLLLTACGPAEQLAVPTLTTPTIDSAPITTPGVEAPTGEISELIVERLEIQTLFIGSRPEISVAIFGSIPSCMEIEKTVGTFVQELIDNVFFIKINPTILNQECNQEPIAFQNYIGLEYEELLAGDYYVEVAEKVVMFVIEDQDQITEVDKANLELILLAVKNHFASGLGISAVEILGLTSVDWADGCLELPEAGEVCTERLIPGYLLTVGNGFRNWEVHINLDASFFRFIEKEAIGDQAEVILVTLTDSEEEVNLRAGPGVVYEIVGTAPGGSQFIAQLQTTDGLWLKVTGENLPPGDAWIYLPLTDFEPPDGFPVILPDTPVIATEEPEATEPSWSEVPYPQPVGNQNLGTEDGIIFVLQDGIALDNDWVSNTLYRFTFDAGLHVLYHSDQFRVGDFAIFPDGEWVYFTVLDKTGNSTSFNKIRTDGSGLALIAEYDLILSHFSLFPNQYQALFESTDISGNDNLLLVYLNTGASRALTTDGCSGAGQWSPDGHWIVFNNYCSDNSNVSLIHPDGSNRVELISNASIENNGAWSPDGRFITYQSNTGTNTDVFMRDMQTGETKNISDYLLDDIWPSWSPDGRYLIYHSIRYETRSALSLFLWDSVSEKTINLSRYIIHQTAKQLAWSEDNQSLLVYAEDGNDYQLYIIEVKTQKTTRILGERIGENPNNVSKAYWGTMLALQPGDLGAGNYFTVEVLPSVQANQVEGPIEPVIAKTLLEINLRSGPGLDYESMGKLQEDTFIEVIGKSWDAFWLQIKYPDAPDGLAWVYSELTNLDSFGQLPVIDPPMIELP